MKPVSVVVGIQVFVSAAAFGVLINMYTVQILKKFSANYAYWNLARRQLPWATGVAVVQSLLGETTTRYMKTRTVLFPWFELTFASLVLLALIVHGLGWAFVRSSAFFALALPLATVSALDESNGSVTPDELTIPATLLGLATSWLPGAMVGTYTGVVGKLKLSAATAGAMQGVESSLLGAAVGYLALYGVYKVFLWTTGKEGMGYGNFKANMMIGAFCGLQLLVPAIMISSVLGAVVGRARILTKGLDERQSMAFTPYQMLAGTILMLWGNAVLPFL